MTHDDMREAVRRLKGLSNAVEKLEASDSGNTQVELQREVTDEQGTSDSVTTATTNGKFIFNQSDFNFAQFTAVGLTPLSVTHQYRAEGFATPWPDAIGTADMAVTGLTASTFGNGETSVVGDGSSDSGTADGPETLPSNETFGVAFTMATTDTTDNSAWMASASDATNSQFQIADFDFADSSNGEIFVSLGDDNSNTLQVETDSAFADGNAHLVVINKTGNNAANIDIYVDDISTPTATTAHTDQAFDNSNYTNTTDMGFYARNLGSSVDNHKAFDAGLFEFNAEPYSYSDRYDLQTRRPEV